MGAALTARGRAGFGVVQAGVRTRGVAEFVAEGADFGEVAGEQAGDLGFEGAGVDDLAERGVGGEGEEVAGDVEGAGLEGAVVGVRLHRVGRGMALGEGVEHVLAEVLVGGEEGLDGGGVGGGLGPSVAGVNQPDLRKSW